MNILKGNDLRREQRRENEERRTWDKWLDRPISKWEIDNRSYPDRRRIEDRRKTLTAESK